MQFLNNILSVAKYESKLLTRSWFFKVFSTVSVILIITSSASILVNTHAFVSIPSLLAYNLMLYFNVAQAIVSIFLASEYLKRDKQLDTSEVFYVRPLSNAEYLLGKMWGTIQVFVLLNFIVMAISIMMGYVLLQEHVSPLSFLMYFFILNIPTLIYIIGLSTFLMLVIKNQALTFVILLGYIGLTLFYIGDKFYYLFDYIGFNLPMLMSTITGFADWQSLAIHRLMYLLLGLGFILCSISLFRRLPNSPRALYPWRAAATLLIVAGLACGCYHVYQYVGSEHFQERLVELNNLHVNDPKMEVDSCRIDVEQQDDLLKFKADIIGTPVNDASAFTFTLNPGFKVASVTMNGKPLQFQREEHLLMIEFPAKVKADERVAFTIEYEGIVDERICYLDIPEETLNQQEKFMDNFNIGKKYGYQSEEYTLLTPEIYWYPRPGVCYSSESPDWQQSYFTNFSMKVKPNAGMTVLSQGERKLSADSLVTSFSPEYPLQSLSLIIGPYKDCSIVVDSTLYSVWYIDGHNFFSQELDLIHDTIPSIISDVRFDYEETVGMLYPFNRFSMIEVPAHFSSYSRTWTQAQEKMQPEMVLVPEKMYNSWRFNIQQQKEWRKNGGRNGRGGGGGGWNRRGQTMTDYDVQMAVFRDMLYFMMDSNTGFDFQEGALGRGTVTVKESPYYIFPQMYNFRYNIYSSEWPVANRLIELMLQNGGNARNSWMRDVNGLSNEEKSLMLMQDASFKDLLKSTEHRDLINNLIMLQGKKLFLDAERKIGVQAFQDTLSAHVLSNAFRNLSFEQLLDTLGQIAGTDIRSQLVQWNQPTELAEFMVGTPNIVRIETATQEIYQAEIVITNLSNQPGSVNMQLQFWSSREGDGKQYFNDEEKPTEWIIDFEPHQTKRIVSHWEESPSAFNVNTLFSKNLPVVVTARSGRIEEVYILEEEGEYILSEDYLNNEEEVIVDNEDTLLFTLSEPPHSGYIGELINKNTEEESFKYVGVSEWNSPARWTSTTDQNYYGRSIRSASVIRSGKGEQYAEWKIPVPSIGRYELYYYVRRPEQLRRNNRGGGRKDYLYEFIISSEVDDYEEMFELDMRRARDGWYLLDTYGITGDTLVVRLTDKSELGMITADAVKIVKK